MSQPELFAPAAGRIGTDESGKGDYFGPLVAAGFFLADGQEEVVRALGVRDSKTLSDRRCRAIAETLRGAYPHSVVSIGPEKYNELYAKMRNLNRLLAWGHARVIENILERVPCGRAVTDQFGDAKYVLNALLKKGRAIELIQRPRGAGPRGEDALQDDGARAQGGLRGDGRHPRDSPAAPCFLRES